jgi:hypothetical protein
MRFPRIPKVTAHMNFHRYILSLFLLCLLLGCAAIPYEIAPDPERVLEPQQKTTFIIKASGDWRSSGVLVEKGSRYQITASGRWRVGGIHTWVGPDGIGTTNVFPIVDGYTEGTLIAKIGDSPPFAVGNSFRLQPPSDGLLYFRINDRTFYDNQGQVEVSVENVTKIVDTLSPPAVSPGRELPKMAVWDLSAGNIPPAYAQDLTSILVSEITKLGKFEVYSQENVRTLAGWAAERMALGCTDTKCLTALGQMDIAKLISGRIGKVGDTYSISLNLFDTQKVKAERSISEFTRSENELISLLQQCVRKLLATNP